MGFTKAMRNARGNDVDRKQLISMGKEYVRIDKEFFLSLMVNVQCVLEMHGDTPNAEEFKELLGQMSNVCS